VNEFFSHGSKQWKGDNDDGDSIGDGVIFLTSTRVIDFDGDQNANADVVPNTISKVVCQDNYIKRIESNADMVVFAVGGCSSQCDGSRQPFALKACRVL
jgi:hypothetical protein